MVKSLLYGDALDASVVRFAPGPITRLPQELVRAIISYFIYDTNTLLACSLICYQWYMVAVSHLHHSLTTDNYRDGPWPYGKYSWPKPLRKSYKLGLLPLVIRFRIRLGNRPWDVVTPKWLSGPTLRYFSALTNLQELGIDNLQLSDFMPTIQQCFGHFSPTLRFLALMEPNGTSRQILYLIGLFPNLQDLKLIYRSLADEQENTDLDAALVPLSTPPLKGRLTLTYFTRENLVKDMITFFGGVRFRFMDLFRVKCVHLLLGTCAGTLETLRLYPTDLYGENLPKRREKNKLKAVDYYTVDNRALLQDSDLSRNSSLRTLETTAESINVVDDTASDFFRTVLSTVTSTVALDVVIVYREFDLGGTAFCWLGCESDPVCFRHNTQKERETDALHYERQFKVFREMHDARDFRLVLCADVFECMVEHAVETLRHAVSTREVNGELAYVLCEHWSSPRDERLALARPIIMWAGQGSGPPPQARCDVHLKC